MDPMRSVRTSVILAGWMSFCAVGVSPAQGGGSSAPIVNNPAPNPATPGFRIPAQPTITVGGLNDDPRYELVDVVDATLTATGRLAVIPIPNTEVRLFDSRGRFVRALGRQGQGPGEFTGVGQLMPRRADSLLAYDGRLGRFTLFDSLGRVSGTVSGVQRATCCFTDGSFLTRRSAVSLSRINLRGIRDTIYYSLVDSTVPNAAPREIISILGEESLVTVQSTFSVPPFGRTPSLRIAGDVFVTGTEETYEYRVYSKRGDLLRTVRAAAVPRAITKADVAAAREQWAGSNRPEVQREREKAFDRLRLPATMPAYGDLRTERDGTVWIRNYRPAGSSEHWWARFDPAGKLLGTLQLPADREVVRFVDGHVILRNWDRTTQTRTLFVHRLEPAGR